MSQQVSKNNSFRAQKLSKIMLLRQFPPPTQDQRQNHHPEPSAEIAGWEVREWG